jgi:hypothetical protein
MHIGQIDNAKLALGGGSSGALANARIDCYGGPSVPASARKSGERSKREHHPKTMLAHLMTMLSQLAQRGV